MRYRVAVLTLGLSLIAVPAAEAAPVRLKAFHSCKDLVSFARAGAQRTGGGVGVAPQSLPGFVGAIASPPAPTRDSTGPIAPTAAPVSGEADGSAPDFSGTNVQELGVDEPDVVKTNGRLVFAVTDRALRIVDVTGGAPIVRATLALDGMGQELLLRGDRLLVIGSPAVVQPTPRPVAPTIAPYGMPSTVVTEVDVSDPAAPEVTRTMTVPGRFVDARQHGSTARLVIDAAPEPIAEPQEAGKSSFLGRTVLKSNLSGRTFKRDLAPCDAVRRPRQFSGLDVLAILTIDLDRGMYSLDRDGVMAGAQVVYGSDDSLYVASRRFVRSIETGTGMPDAVTTEIHRFDISDPEHTVYRATGSVPGFILNSYALSQYKGDLRVATTEQPPWQPGVPSESSSTVTVLHQNGNRLEKVGAVGGLGKGERIYAVRFLGERGFVVTFRQMDPLYALDLSDPAAPKLRGELEIAGYSAYLHPVTDTLLLGVGREGAKVKASLFDVSNLATPKLASQVDLGDGFTTLESQPHAFLYWAKTGTAVFPLQTASFYGAVALHAGAAPLSEIGRIAHPVASQPIGAPIERAFVIGDKLYTLSYAGLGVNRLDTLAGLGFTGFGS
jgi:Beta propeller domain